MRVCEDQKHGHRSWEEQRLCLLHRAHGIVAHAVVCARTRYDREGHLSALTELEKRIGTVQRPGP